MVCKSEINWHATHSDIISAKNTILPNKRFVKTRHIVEHVTQNRESYPSLEYATPKQILYRAQRSFADLGWVAYTEKGARDSVYIDPEVIGE